jgi:titin
MLETSYTLFHSTVNDTGTATAAVSFPSNSTSGIDSGLTLGNKYFFWIKAYSEFGGSGFSSVFSNILDVPAQPAIQYFEANSPTVMVAGWDNLPNETGYTLRFSLNNNFATASNTLRLGMNTNTFWSSAYIPSILPDTLYFFWVNAFNVIGSSAYSFASNWTPPNPPLFLTVPVSFTDIGVGWLDMNTETSYTLYMNTNNSTASAQKFYFPADTIVSLQSGLTTGKKYYFWMKAVNPGGTSAFSAVVTNRTLIPVLPGQPVFHEVTPVTGTTNLMTVVWSDQTNELGYKLYRNSTKSTNGGTNVLLPAGWTNITDINLKAGTTYYYWVKAGNLGGWSPLSLIASNTTLWIPVKPVLSSVTALSTNILSVCWNDLPNETSYTLFRNLIDDTNTATNIAGFAADTTRFTNTGLQTNTTYFYWLKAYNSVGVSGFSAVKSGKTKTPVRLIMPDGDFAVYPNLVDLSAGDTAGIVFAKAGTVDILIYSPRGVLVREFRDKTVSPGTIIEWNGCYGDSSDKVGASVYIAVVKGAGFTRKPVKFIIKK